MVENIIVSEVSWVQKAEGCIFLSYVENKLNTEYKHYCIDIEIYTKHMFCIYPKVRLAETKRGGKEGKDSE
jgi:hypothetical protein